MTPLVIDASALIELLFDTSRSAPLTPLIEAGQTSLHVPALCDIEVTSAVAHLIQRRTISSHRATEALADYLNLRLEKHGHRGFLQRVLELRDNFTAYDAVYVALSERLSAPLLTADARLARAARAHTEITVLPSEV